MSARTQAFLMILFTIAPVGLVLSQEIPIDIIDRVNAVDYIFEGKVIHSTPYKTANGKYIYTSNTIQITKILKGDLTCGTVELITDGGFVDDLGVEVSHSLDLRKGCSGIFLAKGTAKELSAIDFYTENNLPKLEATFENQSFIKYWHDGVEWRVSDMWANFDSLAQVYNLAELITGLNFVDCGLPNLWDGGTQRGPQATPTTRTPAALRPDLDVIRAKIAEVAYQKAHFQRAARGGGGPEVSYEMTNMAITGTEPRYLEFDINIHDDQGSKYLYYGGVHIVYDPLVFGTQIGQTVNCEVTNGTLIADGNCYGLSYPSDLNANSFYAFAYPAFQSNCKALVPTTPVQLFHVKMRILDCVSSTISLADTAYFDFGPSVVLYYSTYSGSPDDPEFTEYASAQHEQTEVVEECGPAITSFSPTTVAGGIQQILEIHGRGFGEVRGTGSVFFKNANDGGATEVYCDASDFTVDGWSDDLIRLFVPSSDTAIVGDSLIPRSPAGSGIFRVVTNEGLSLESPTELSIRYSVSSDHLTYPKTPVRLATRSVFDGQFKFHVDSSVAAYDDGAFLPVIKKALREWTCLTGIGWELVEDSVYQVLPNAEADSLCVIRFGDLGDIDLPFAKIAETSRYAFPCSDRLYTAETDLVVNDDPDILWFIDTIPENPIPEGAVDLFHILLHELGHAHNLKHVNAPEQIMWFADNTFEGFRKIQLYADPSAYEGGNWVIDASFTLPPDIDSCDYLSTIPLSTSPICSGFYGIDERASATLVQVQPNPFLRTIQLTALDRKICRIEIFSSVGSLLLQQTIQPTLVTELDLSDLMDGLLLLMIGFEDHSSLTVKVIKE